MEWFDTSMKKHNEPGIEYLCDVEAKLGELTRKS